MILYFSLLQTGENLMSSRGNRTIGIFNGPKKYDPIKQSFSSLITEINQAIKNGYVEVDGKKVKLELFIGGDYKFLLMVMGLSGATSDYAYALYTNLSGGLLQNHYSSTIVGK